MLDIIKALIDGIKRKNSSLSNSN